MTNISEHSFINSQYFKIANEFKQKPLSYVTALVEDRDDVEFWDNLFKRFATNVKVDCTPNLGDGNRGKDHLLKDCINGVGPNTVICVDSDYHYLLKIFTDELPTEEVQKIKKINENPFIFHTYTYSIENYLAHPENLDELTRRICKVSNQPFEFKKFIEDYSKTIFPLFMYILYFVIKGQEKTFSKENLLEIIALDTDDYESLSVDQILTKLKSKVDIYVNKFEEKYPDANLLDIEKKLKKLGVFKHNVFLFIRGHDYLKKVAAPILKRIVRLVKKQHEEEIKNSSADTNRKKELLNQLKNAYKKVNFINELENNSM